MLVYELSVHDGQSKSDDDPSQDPAQAKQKAAYAAIGNDVKRDVWRRGYPDDQDLG